MKIIATKEHLEEVGISENFNISGKECEVIRSFPDGWKEVEVFTDYYDKAVKFDLPDKYLK